MARTPHSVRRMLFGLAALSSVAAAQPAAAQFGWFGQDEVSTREVYDTIGSHGFRLVGPLMQNRDVYIADVVDRRQRRQRLIISRSDGRIIQRFMVDVGRASTALPGSPAGGALPPRNRAEPDFFSRLAHGFGDDGPPPRPPATIDTPDAVVPRPERTVRPKPSDVEPRLATRRDDAPVTSRPLAPEPQPFRPVGPAVPAEKPAPVQATPAVPPAASAPATASTAPARATIVTSDPLRIPGAKDEKPTATAAKAPEPAKPKPADVPVVPLD